MHEKYDAFYAGSNGKEQFTDIVLSGYPRNRTEAILYAGGQGDKILDIGCGSGLLLFQFRKAFKVLVGVEYSKFRLDQAKINLQGENFVAINGSAEDLGMIASNTIDQIISSDTIEHIPDVYRAVKEMYRVLKPGGRLVVNTPNIAFIKKRALLLVGRFPSTSQPNEGVTDDLLYDGGHLHYFTFRSLSLILSRAGFCNLRKMGYGNLGFLCRVWPTLWSGGVQVIADKSGNL